MLIAGALVIVLAISAACSPTIVRNPLGYTVAPDRTRRACTNPNRWTAHPAFWPGRSGRRQLRLQPLRRIVPCNQYGAHIRRACKHSARLSRSGAQRPGDSVLPGAWRGRVVWSGWRTTGAERCRQRCAVAVRAGM